MASKQKQNKAVTITKQGELAKPPHANLQTFVPKGQDDEAGFGVPSAIKNLEGSDSSIKIEWSPKEPGEWLLGRIIQVNVMSLGGCAYVFETSPDPKEKSVPVMLVRGGKVLDNRMSALGPEVGGLFYVQYNGEQATDKGSPMRLWYVKKISQKVTPDEFIRLYASLHS